MRDKALLCKTERRTFSGRVAIDYARRVVLDDE